MHASPVLDTLDAFGRGVLIGVVAMEGDERHLECLGEAYRETCVQAWRALGSLDADVRGATLARWREHSLGSVPTGGERLHPSWMEELASLARRDTAPLSPSAKRDLERSAFASLAVMFEDSEAEREDPAWQLGGLDLEEVLARLATEGARTLGRSLSSASPAVRAKIMASMGEPWAGYIAASSAGKVSEAERATARVCASSKLPASVTAPAHRLLYIGLATLRHEMSGRNPALLGRVAGRLPAPLGRWLLGW
jgi:hypothetical protein